MKIERYFANDTKTAMARVRAELGAEAMILANRRVAGRVELTAAVDIDDAVDARAGARADPGKKRRGRAAARESAANELSLKALERELCRLRNILEHELGDRSWQDAAGLPAPAAALRQRLLRLGLSRSLADELLDVLPPIRQLEPSWRLARRALCQRLRIAGDTGADTVTALFGGTGVGKTSSIAKLAGRDVQRSGARAVGLITLDGRLGAREQLASFADALGVPLRSARDGATLSRALRKLRGRRIYVDTAAMGPRDEGLLGQWELLQSQRVKLQSLLVLSASAQPSQSRLIASRFKGRQVSGAIITKVDEALSLGGVMDVLARGALPLHSVSDGQAVPADLHAVDPEWLVRRSLELMRGDHPALAGTPPGEGNGGDKMGGDHPALAGSPPGEGNGGDKSSGERGDKRS